MVIKIRRMGVCALFLLLFYSCDYPRVHRRSESDIRTVRVGDTTAVVERRLGQPSFKWPRAVFTAHGYPSSPVCAAKTPASMWVYYDDRGMSVCVYVNDDRVQCVEQNWIVLTK